MALALAIARANGGCSCRSESVPCAHHDDAPDLVVDVANWAFNPEHVPTPRTKRTRAGAIPTKYGGTQFRSRLEARWASFFDLMAWPWEYEPLDLDGYIPDFILGFYRPLLVEVKPITSWPPSAAVAEQLRKVAASGWDGEAIAVGAYPLTTTPGAFLLGRFLLEHIQGESAVPSDSGVEPFYCQECDRLSFGSDAQSFRCRVVGCVGTRDINIGAAKIVLSWREAGNRVQWRRQA
jgi:hypothetical protein